MSILQNALSGALAAQVALNTVSTNVANSATEGYTRQGVLLATVKATSGLSAGNGVTVSSLIRFSDDYKSLQLWQAASTLGQADAAQTYLTQLEEVMGSDDASVNTGLDAFFNALNAASADPASNPLRQQVLTEAEALCSRINSLQTVMANQRSAVQLQRSSTVDEINSTTAQIATLNSQIAFGQASGQNVSSLIDERDQCIDSLSSMVEVQTVTQADGTRSVSLVNGAPLVVGSQASTLTVSSNASGGQDLVVQFATQSFNVTGVDVGGALGGLDDYESDVLVPMQTAISDLASSISTLVNDQLAAGSAPPDTSAGQALFVYDATSSSAMLTINPDLEASELAFGASGSTDEGDSTNLLALIALQSSEVSVGSLGTVTLGDAYTQLVGRLGVLSQQNQAELTTAQTVRDQAESSWAATSGVNTDEEAINLVQYQQMYEANMKVIAVANQLFDSVLSMFD